jgi:hypothetical protein
MAKPRFGLIEQAIRKVTSQAPPTEASNATAPKPFQWKSSLKKQETIEPTLKPKVTFSEPARKNTSPFKAKEFAEAVLPPAPPPLPPVEYVYPSKQKGNRSGDQITRFAPKARLTQLMQSHAFLLDSNRQTTLASAPKLDVVATQTEMLWMAEMLAQNLKRSKRPLS